MMSAQIQVTVDGTARTVATDSKPTLIFEEIYPDRVKPGPNCIVVCKINGVLRDLWTDLTEGDVIESIAINSEEGLMVLRHSTAHVLAQAVQETFPQTRLGIGPPINDGFYYDFDPEKPFTPEDLTRLESVMKKIIKDGQRFKRRPITDSDALKELAHEPYKCELVTLKSSDAAEGASVEVGAGELTIYDNLGRDGKAVWGDLCRGPHIPSTKYIPAYKLMRSAGAYWRGSEKNPMLQRIYGTAWPSQEELDQYLHLLAEAEKRDHRRLGAELDLFSFPEEIGSGLAVFHPKGGIVRRAMEDYSRKRHEEEDYQFVYSPHLTKAALFETSGHLQWYAEGMYPPMVMDEELHADGTIKKAGQKYYMKPMNCLALQDFLEKEGIETRVQTAIAMGQVAEPYIPRRSIRHLEKGRVVIFGAGAGMPFFTTDTVAAQRALEIGVDALLLAKSGVDGVYSADPRKDKDAKRYDVITYDEVLSKSLAVADAAAFSLCRENKLPIVVFNLLENGNIARAVRGEAIGTLVN